MSKRYPSVEDAQMRLGGTIIRYKGKPVYIPNNRFERGENGELLVMVVDPVNRDRNEFVDIDSEELDISSPPLGYCNYQGQSVYLSRAPLRRQKQGLSSENLITVYDGPDRTYFNRADRDFPIAVKAIAEAIIGVYPTVEEMFYLFTNKDTVSVAFHRKFALLRGKNNIFKLRHMGETVGFVDGKTIQLFSGLDSTFFTKPLLNLGFRV